MKIREVIEALLKENAELRQGALAHGLTLGVGFAGRDAGRAVLKQLDDLDVRITEYLAEALRPQPYDTPERE